MSAPGYVVLLIHVGDGTALQIGLQKIKISDGKHGSVHAGREPGEVALVLPVENRVHLGDLAAAKNGVRIFAEERLDFLQVALSRMFTVFRRGVYLARRGKKQGGNRGPVIQHVFIVPNGRVVEFPGLDQVKRVIDSQHMPVRRHVRRIFGNGLHVPAKESPVELGPTGISGFRIIPDVNEVGGHRNPLFRNSVCAQLAGVGAAGEEQQQQQGEAHRAELSN